MEKMADRREKACSEKNQERQEEMSSKPGVIFLKDGTQISIPCDAMDVSDGCHTYRDHK